MNGISAAVMKNFKNYKNNLYDSCVLKILLRLTCSEELTPCAMTSHLCDQELETPMPMCLHCSYAKEVWKIISNWTSRGR